MANTNSVDTANTIMSNIKTAKNENMTNYSLFMGGTNVTHDVLASYDPLKTGYSRIFMVHTPTFLEKNMHDKLKNFKHILEYGNTSIQGLGGVTVNFNQIQGGYVGKSFEIPSVAQDDTTQFSINVYEFSGSPVREVLHSWINGTNDLLTGLCHYNGANVDVSQSNQTAEFIYVVTDNTGKEIEYACLLANCFPRGINMDTFNYTSGEHNLVEMNIEFSCTKYESSQINKVAKALLKKYTLLTNSLDFYSGYKDTDSSLGGNSGYKYGTDTGTLVSL